MTSRATRRPPRGMIEAASASPQPSALQPRLLPIGRASSKPKTHLLKRPSPAGLRTRRDAYSFSYSFIRRLRLVGRTPVDAPGSAEGAGRSLADLGGDLRDRHACHDANARDRQPPLPRIGERRLPDTVGKLLRRQHVTYPPPPRVAHRPRTRDVGVRSRLRTHEAQVGKGPERRSCGQGRRARGKCRRSIVRPTGRSRACRRAARRAPQARFAHAS